jgi:hypothetical protein
VRAMKFGPARPTRVRAVRRHDKLTGTVDLTQIVQKLGNFCSLRSPPSSILNRTEAGIGKKIAQTDAPVD